MRELRGKRVLITGGAGGIGLEMAIGFAEKGAGLVLADRDETALPEAVEAVEVLGVPALGQVVDVTDPESIRGLCERVAAEAGPIDVLVNNAGVVFGGPFAEVPLERHVATFNVNVMGLLAVTHAMLPDLERRPEAHLVNVASASAFLGLPYGTSYAASKWAVLGFTESIRAELEERGQRHVGVTAVCPSYVDTGMFDGVHTPIATRMLRPEHVARQVVAAVEQNRRYVLEPWLVKIAPTLKGLLPSCWFDVLASSLGVSTGMTGWRGRETPPDDD